MPANPKVVGLWPHFSATIWLWAVAQRAFFCHIARSDNMDIFSVTSRGCELLASQAMTTTIVFLLLYCNKQTTTIQPLHCITNKRWPRGIVKSKPVCTLYCKDKRQLLHHITREARMWNILHVVLQKAMTMCLFYVTSQKAMTQSYATEWLSSQGCEQLAVIAIHDCWSQAGWRWSYFLTLHCNEQATMTTFFRPIARERANW